MNLRDVKGLEIKLSLYSIIMRGFFSRGKSETAENTDLILTGVLSRKRFSNNPISLADPSYNGNLNKVKERNISSGLEF